jgi:hypothetical protein
MRIRTSTQPGGFITPIFRQSEKIYAALTVAKNETMKVVWTDSGELKGWKDHDFAFGTNLHVLRRPKADVFPIIGQLAIVDIEASALVKLRLAIQGRGAYDIAKLALETIGQVIRYALLLTATLAAIQRLISSLVTS